MSLIETKLFIKSVISDHDRHNSKFESMELKDFLLATPMDRTEYQRIYLIFFSNKFIDMHELQPKIFTYYRMLLSSSQRKTSKRAPYGTGRLNNIISQFISNV